MALGEDISTLAFRAWALGDAMERMHELVQDDLRFSQQVRDFSAHVGRIITARDISASDVSDCDAYLKASVAYRVEIKRKGPQPLTHYFCELERAIQEYSDARCLQESEAKIAPVMRRIGKNAYLLAAAIEHDTTLRDAYLAFKEIGDARGPHNLSEGHDLDHPVSFDNSLAAHVPALAGKRHQAYIFMDPIINYGVISRIVQDNTTNCIEVEIEASLRVLLDKAA